MFMLTLDSPEVLDHRHRYPKMITKRATGQVESTFYICTLFSAAAQKGGTRQRECECTSGRLTPPSFLHALSRPLLQSNPLHSANCPPYRLSPRAKRNDSVRAAEGGRRRETREERAKCRQTMNDISPPSLLSSIPVFPFHLASLVTAIIALPAWVLLAGRPRPFDNPNRRLLLL